MFGESGCKADNKINSDGGRTRRDVTLEAGATCEGEGEVARAV